MLKWLLIWLGITQRHMRGSGGREIWGLQPPLGWQFALVRKSSLLHKFVQTKSLNFNAKLPSYSDFFILAFISRFTFAVKLSLNPWIAWKKTLKQEFAHEEYVHYTGLTVLKRYYVSILVVGCILKWLHRTQSSRTNEYQCYIGEFCSPFAYFYFDPSHP